MNSICSRRFSQHLSACCRASSCSIYRVCTTTRFTIARSTCRWDACGKRSNPQEPTSSSSTPNEARVTFSPQPSKRCADGLYSRRACQAFALLHRFTTLLVEHTQLMKSGQPILCVPRPHDLSFLEFVDVDRLNNHLPVLCRKTHQCC